MTKRKNYWRVAQPLLYLTIGAIGGYLFHIGRQEEALTGKGPALPQRATYTLYYFPELNLYLDTARRVFVYSLDGTRTWDERPAGGLDSAASLGPRYPVTSPLEEGWRLNEEHRWRYGGVVVDIIPEEPPPPPPAAQDTAGPKTKPDSLAVPDSSGKRTKLGRKIREFLDRIKL